MLEENETNIEINKKLLTQEILEPKSLQSLEEKISENTSREVFLEQVNKETLPVKRKRGRPRKHPLPDPDLPKIPKKRGRKPKPKSPEDQKILAKVKKRPGRPPKKDKTLLSGSLGKINLSPVVKARKKINKKKLSNSLPGESLANLLASNQEEFEKFQSRENSKTDTLSSKEERNKNSEISRIFPEKEVKSNLPSWLERDWTKKGQRIVIKKGDSGNNEFFPEDRVQNNSQDSQDPTLQKEYVSKVIQQIKSIYTKRKKNE